MRIDEPGWVRVGADKRRSLWVRISMTDPNASRYEVDTVESIEFCAGRDGDDCYVRATVADTKFSEMLNLATTLLFAAECCEEGD